MKNVSVELESPTTAMPNACATQAKYSAGGIRASRSVSSSVKHAGPHPPRLIMRPQTTHASRSSSGEKGSRHPRHAAFPLLPFLLPLLPLVPLATTRSPATPCMGAASAGPPRVRRAAGAMEPRAPGQALSFPRPVVRVDRLLIELN